MAKRTAAQARIANAANMMPYLGGTGIPAKLTPGGDVARITLESVADFLEAMQAVMKDVVEQNYATSEELNSFRQQRRALAQFVKDILQASK